MQIVQAALFVYTRSIANLAAMALPFAKWHEKAPAGASAFFYDYIFSFVS